MLNQNILRGLRHHVMTKRRKMTNFHTFITRSLSGTSIKDDDSDIQRDAILRRVNDAMQRKPTYPESQEMIRKFWKDRRLRNRRKLWSILDIMRSVKARTHPLKVAAFHGIYCVGITSPYVIFLFPHAPHKHTHTHTTKTDSCIFTQTDTRNQHQINLLNSYFKIRVLLLVLPDF